MKARTSGPAQFSAGAGYDEYTIELGPQQKAGPTSQSTPEEERVNVPKVAAARRPQHKPKLGQHFLASDEYARRIAEAVGDISQSTVLEIGPGRGIITSLLAKRARRLIAVELDRVLAAQLRLKFGMARHVEIIEADILLRLFAFSKYFESIVIMVQREVADRIAAEPGGREYGMLSATAQLYARVENLFTVPPEAFAPAPKVHSAVVGFVPHDVQPEASFLARMEKLTAAAFGQRRKMLRGALKAVGGEALLAAAGIAADRRAETLSVAEFDRLARLVSAQQC